MIDKKIIRGETGKALAVPVFEEVLRLDAAAHRAPLPHTGRPGRLPARFEILPRALPFVIP